MNVTITVHTSFCLIFILASCVYANVVPSVNIYESASIVSGFRKPTADENEMRKYLRQIRPSRTAKSIESRWFSSLSPHNYSVPILNSFYVYDGLIVKVLNAFVTEYGESIPRTRKDIVDRYLLEWYDIIEPDLQRFERVANQPSIEIPAALDCIKMILRMLRRVLVQYPEIRELIEKEPIYIEYSKRLEEAEAQVGILWQKPHEEAFSSLLAKIKPSLNKTEKDFILYGTEFEGLSTRDLAFIALAAIDQNDMDKAKYWIDKAKKAMDNIPSKGNTPTVQLNKAKTNESLDSGLCAEEGQCKGATDDDFDVMYLDILQKTSAIIKKTEQKEKSTEETIKTEDLCENGQKTKPSVGSSYTCKYRWKDSLTKGDKNSSSKAEDQEKKPREKNLEVPIHWLIPQRIEVIHRSPDVLIFHKVTLGVTADFLKHVSYPVLHVLGKAKDPAVTALSPTFWSPLSSILHQDIAYLYKKIALYTGISVEEHTRSSDLSYLLVYLPGEGGSNKILNYKMEKNLGDDERGTFLLNIEHTKDITVAVPYLNLREQLPPGSAMYIKPSSNDRHLQPILCPSDRETRTVFFKKLDKKQTKKKL